MTHAAPDTAAAPTFRSATGSLRLSPSQQHYRSSLLHAARVLLGYGRHLIDTIRLRAAAPNFHVIAECFGTSNLSTILAHLNRGILRATALERVLLARAATGKDIDFVERRTRTQPEPLSTPCTRTSRPTRPAGWSDPELFMPTLEDLERQVRRRPIGSTIIDICLDLAAVPGFCHTASWNELFDIMTCFGSSIDKLRQKARRREAFGKEQDRTPGRTGTGCIRHAKKSARSLASSSASRQSTRSTLSPPSPPARPDQHQPH